MIALLDVSSDEAIAQREKIFAAPHRALSSQITGVIVSWEPTLANRLGSGQHENDADIPNVERKE